MENIKSISLQLNDKNGYTIDSYDFSVNVKEKTGLYFVQSSSPDSPEVYYGAGETIEQAVLSFLGHALDSFPSSG